MAKDLNLIIVAHPDDEILGFGGTGVNLIKKGEIVQPIILSGKANQRTQKPSEDELLKDSINANKKIGFNPPIFGDFPNLRMNTIDTIEIVKFIEKYIVQFKPQRIFTHHPSDLNDDHFVISRSCLTASKIFLRKNEDDPINSIYFMEIMSSSDWNIYPNNGLYLPNTFINIENSISSKIEALKCYRNVMRQPPHPRSEHAIRAIAAHRGAQSGAKYAESFQNVYRKLI